MTEEPVDTATADVHRYRARFADPAGDGDAELRLTVDRIARTLTYHLPARPAVTVDLPTARALSMLLRDGVYFSLTPDGPTVWMECDEGDGRGWIKA